MKMKFLNKPILLIVLVLMAFVQLSVAKTLKLNDTLEFKAKLIHSEKFNCKMKNWKVEQMPGGKVFINNKKMEIDDAAGCTVWYTKKLSGPIMIEYDAFVIKNGGVNDRVSDLNCFWMANDPDYPTDLFRKSDFRGGKFPNYDYLKLYYVGLGGHNNTKTRFRRYEGGGERPILPEYDLSAQEFLITPNVTYRIRLVAYDGFIQYYRNNKLIFTFVDTDAYTSGYFGIRTVNNHMTIDNLKIYQLKN